MVYFPTMVSSLISSYRHSVILLNTSRDAQGNSSMQLVCFWLGAEQQGYYHHAEKYKYRSPIYNNEFPAY